MVSSPDESIKPTMKSFNLVLSALSKCGDATNVVGQAMKSVAQLKQYHESNMNNRMVVDHHHDDDDDTEEAADADDDDSGNIFPRFEYSTEPDTKTYNRLLACVNRSNRPNMEEIVDQILERMKQFETMGHVARRPDRNTYTGVIHSHYTSFPPNFHRVESLLKELCDRYDQSRNISFRPAVREFNLCVSDRPEGWYVQYFSACTRQPFFFNLPFFSLSLSLVMNFSFFLIS